MSLCKAEKESTIDIVLRTVTVSISERMSISGFKNTVNTVDRILEFQYAKCKKEFQDIMKDLCWNTKRNTLAIKNVRSLNGLFGVQCYSSDSNNQHEEIMQLRYCMHVHF